VSASALVLFDIDGTLLRRSGEHHKQALVQSIREVAGVPVSFDNVPTAGMLDCDLLHLLLGGSGMEPHAIDAALPHLITAAQQAYINNCPPHLADRVCPGVVDLLNALTSHKAAIGLVTGNLSAIGWKKMELAGLHHHFHFGAFSERHATRAQLAEAAIRQARDSGLILSTTRISLIGDHPNDIQAARLNGIQAIATATGVTPWEELQSAGPDILVRDLSELDVRQLL
jgi:phosphoglycolate phosphatase